MGKISKDVRSPLLPDRHPEDDFFICDVFDAAPKADIGSMEHPIFSLSTKPDLKPRKYNNNSIIVEVTPSIHGLATVYDRDILIYCISQLIYAMNEGKKVSKTVRFKAYDLLKSTNRMTNGQAYKSLKESLERLRGTTISTNIATGKVEQTDIFGLIDRARILKETRDGKMQEIEVQLSDWVFNAIRANEVLTISREYFRLRKPLERRIYELARKHCGRQKAWKIGLENLKNKTGSTSSLKEFRRLVSAIADEDERLAYIPDYRISFDNENDMLIVRSKGTVPTEIVVSLDIPKLDPDTYELARQAAPGWDVRYIEAEWRKWATEMPRNPDIAFIGFCRKWFERRGSPT